MWSWGRNNLRKPHSVAGSLRVKGRDHSNGPLHPPEFIFLCKGLIRRGWLLLESWSSMPSSACPGFSPVPVRWRKQHSLVGSLSQSQQILKLYYHDRCSINVHWKRTGAQLRCAVVCHSSKATDEYQGYIVSPSRASITRCDRMCVFKLGKSTFDFSAVEVKREEIDLACSLGPLVHKLFSIV